MGVPDNAPDDAASAERPAGAWGDWKPCFQLAGQSVLFFAAFWKTQSNEWPADLRRT